MGNALEFDAPIRYNRLIYECFGLEESRVRIRVLKAVAALAACLLLAPCALAEQMVTTTVVMRVSHMTQNAVVDAGEDLSMEVNIDGAAPASYQWYFDGVPIPGATQKVYNIVDAQVEDAGVYRLDAFDADGGMIVSMDISARVIDDVVPQSGDDSLPLPAVWAAMGASALGLALAVRRRGARA